MSNLTGKTVLVTGGAQGIGYGGYSSLLAEALKHSDQTHAEVFAGVPGNRHFDCDRSAAADLY